MVILVRTASVWKGFVLLLGRSFTTEHVQVKMKICGVLWELKKIYIQSCMTVKIKININDKARGTGGEPCKVYRTEYEHGIITACGFTGSLMFKWIGAQTLKLSWACNWSVDASLPCRCTDGQCRCTPPAGRTASTSILAWIASESLCSSLAGILPFLWKVTWRPRCGQPMPITWMP